MINSFINYLCKLYPGSRLEDTKNKEEHNDVKIGKGNKSIGIQTNDVLYKIIREENFSEIELKMIGKAIDIVSKILNKEMNSLMYNGIIENTFDQLIISEFIEFNSRFNSPNKHSANFVDNILKSLSYWRNKTYEGKSISLGIIISTKNAYEELDIFNSLCNDYFAPITDGMNSFIRIDMNGNLIGYEQYNSFNNDSILPYRFSSIDKLREEKIIILTRLGDILLISDGKLRYAKKDKQWIQYNSEKIIKRLTATIEISDIKLKEAIYQTCIDISFAKTGCVIGVIESKKKFNIENLVDDSITKQKIYIDKNNSLLKLINKRKFQELERELRKEIASIDGCIALDNEGNVLCVGTIIRIDGGSLGGGRTAASIAISRYGIGIKVSTDGYIQLFRKGNIESVLRIE